LEQIHQLNIEINTAATLALVYSYTPQNSLYYHLNSDTKTIPIMDEYDKSDKQYLIFGGQYKLCSERFPYPEVDLVVVRCREEVLCYRSNLTMTDLKNNGGTLLRDTRIEEKHRLEPLYQELLGISKEKLIPGNAVAFQKPCLLGGQTSNDRRNYGSEYCGDYLVCQGTEYGETTKFLIIGAIVS
jgi:hypothetical protein